MTTFKLFRKEDLTGTSGVGHVASGTILGNGHACVHWVVPANLADGSQRVIETYTVFKSWQDCILLHGHGGRTVLVFDLSIEGMPEFKEIIYTDLDLLAKKGVA